MHMIKSTWLCIEIEAASIEKAKRDSEAPDSQAFGPTRYFKVSKKPLLAKRSLETRARY